VAEKVAEAGPTPNNAILATDTTRNHLECLDSRTYGPN